MPDSCPFCTIPAEDLIWESDTVVAIRDRFPVSPGHTLVITRGHRATYFDATPTEQAEIWRAVAEIKTRLDREFAPAGYNVGFNAQAAAGQTVMHLHVHVIPRYKGDLPDPRGGVRGVIPHRQKYSDMPSLAVADASASYTSDPFAHVPSFVPGQEAPFAVVLRQAFRLAEAVDIVVAFVQPSGLGEIREDMRQALERGARVRLLTGDYMNTTSANALRSLLALRSEFPDQFEPFFFLGGGDQSFHAKAYIFLRGSNGIAFVGSANLSRRALTDGIEWNLRTVSSAEGREFEAVRQRFEFLLASPDVKPLTREIIDEYEARAEIPPAPEPQLQPLTPHLIQQEALEALARLRADGARAGLVVMATGLGKTYLSALDFKQLGGERALFIAHREEILTQAKDAWERVFPEKVLGLLVGEHYEPDAEVMFASVQTLSRNQHLRRFASDHFHYVVIDEIHHAAARTYRRVAGYFEPQFLLGLTATPDRMDGQSILDLCHDNLAYRAGLVRGIEAGLLVPFRYFGVRDEIDFEQIPWRGRWPIDLLTEHASTQERAAQALREYQKHAPAGPRRTLAFCCSTAHADFMAEYFRDHGISAVAVHSGVNSAPRAESLKRLRQGELEILCAVDIFNEGLDVPDINVVLMLRPTESPVIFLQQLGRGLRRGQEGTKPHLTVVDFIGNHRSFLVKPQALLALVGQDLPAGAALRALRDGGLELPDGCAVEIETEAIEMLERLARLSRDDLLVYQYTSLRDSHGRRPTPAEIYASGVNVRTPVTDRYGTWFDFVEHQGDLSDVERAVLEAHRDWFSDLMTTSMTRSYKMVTLRAMLEGAGLGAPVTAVELARQARRIMTDDPLLKRDLDQVNAAPDPDAALLRTWREQPLRVWSEGKSASRRWFSFEHDEFAFLGQVAAEHMAVFEDMTAELVELRLAEYRDRLRGSAAALATPMRLRVSHSNGNPILRFDRARLPGMPPAGTELPVLFEGERYLLRVQKIAINVASREPGGANELPSLMRRWFGPSAGLPGSNHYALLGQNEGHWVLTREAEPGSLSAGSNVIPFPELTYYPDYQVACGALEFSEPNLEEQMRIPVKVDDGVDPSRHFLVRASGNSMSGVGSEFHGAFPVSDGELVLCEWMDATSIDQVENTMCLVSGVEGHDRRLAALKIPVRREGQWYLHSTNPGYEDEPIPNGVRLHAIARPLRVVEPAATPALWARYDREAVTNLFGMPNNRSWQVGHKDVDLGEQGHTILFVTLRKGPEVPLEQRYADKFISPSEFQWESQANTRPTDKKARRILEQPSNGQIIHLFCRYGLEKGEPFTYCGRLRYGRHRGSQPIRIWFDLENPLPEPLWRVWSV